MKVLFKPRAEIQIQEVGKYIIEEIKMPETGLKYLERMNNFALNIGAVHNAYTICRDTKWALKQLKCAIFDNKWIFAFKMINNKIVIYEVKHGKNIKQIVK